MIVLKIVIFILLCTLSVLLCLEINSRLDIKLGLNNSKKYIGDILIRKDDEAIDGQIQFTKDLWEISELKEVTLKVKILPGEPGDWESKK